MGSLRVLLVIDGMHPRDGGPPAVVAGSAKALQDHGLRVSVATTVRLGDEDVVQATWQSMVEAGVSLHFLPLGNPLSLVLTRAASSELCALIDDADVVHLHSFWSAMIVSAAHYAVRKKVPYVISTHGVLDCRAMRRTRFKWFKKRIFVEFFGIRRLLDQAAAVVFGTEAEAKESWDLAPGMRRVFIPNGVAAPMTNDRTRTDARRLRVEAAPRSSVWHRSLLYFSRIHPEKGPDMLVKAFNAVASDFPDAGLFMAGLRQDEALLAEVSSLIEEGGHQQQIFLTTDLTGGGAQFLHSACDIFVLPSHAEGFSVAMVEALAHGMPCLITTFCHAPLVESEGAGVIVSPTPEGIEVGLRQLLSLAPDELAAMGGRARALFEAHYTWDRVAKELEAVYRSTLADKGG